MTNNARNKPKDGFAIKLVRRIHSELSVGSLGIGRTEAQPVSTALTTPPPTTTSARTRTRSHSHPNFESGFRWLREAEDARWNWPSPTSNAMFRLAGDSHSVPKNARLNQNQGAKQPANPPSISSPNRISRSQDAQTLPPPPPPGNNCAFASAASVARASRDARPKHRRTSSVHHESNVFPLVFPNHGFNLSGG